MRRICVSSSEDETRRLGGLLAGALEPGDVIGLCGPLGAGKTTLVRGIAGGLGVREEEVRSPSFALMHEYRSGRFPLFHIDLYRLSLASEDVLALREVLDGDGVAVVEWWEHLVGERASLVVHLELLPDDRRRLSFCSEEGRLLDWMDAAAGASQQLREVI